MRINYIVNPKLNNEKTLDEIELSGQNLKDLKINEEALVRVMSKKVRNFIVNSFKIKPLSLITA
jgi:hypothetical protein